MRVAPADVDVDSASAIDGPSEEALAEARQEIRALTQTCERLDAQNRALMEYVSVVSHEIRTPVTGISAHAWTLNDFWDRLSEADRRRSVQAISRRASRLQHLLTNLLTLSRMDGSGLLTVTPERVDLCQLIQRVTGALAEEHVIRVIDVQLPADVPAVFADPSRVEQTLINLIDNALKFSPSDSSVRVSATVAPTEVMVHVRDHGAGIHADDQPKLFQRFVRLPADARAAKPGMGIGLYLSRVVLQAQGGRIWVESEPGAGSTFSFTLPRAEAAGANVSRHDT